MHLQTSSVLMHKTFFGEKQHPLPQSKTNLKKQEGEKEISSNCTKRGCTFMALSVHKRQSDYAPSSSYCYYWRSSYSQLSAMVSCRNIFDNFVDILRFSKGPTRQSDLFCLFVFFYKKFVIAAVYFGGKCNLHTFQRAFLLLQVSLLAQKNVLLLEEPNLI